MTFHLWKPETIRIRRSSGQLLARLIAVLALASVAFTQSAYSADGTPAKGGVLNVILSQNIGNLDPHKSNIGADRHVLTQIYETLVSLAPDLTVQPGLAASWNLENSLSLVMDLREDVKFHDGTPFNAEAAKWNLDRILNPDNKLAARANISNIESVDVLGEYQIRLNLKAPDSSIFSRLSERPGMMVSPAAVEKFDADFSFNPVGTGPFVFVEWIKDNSVKLSRNPAYWDSRYPIVDEVNIRIVLDTARQSIELITGNADILELVTPKDATFLENQEGIELHRVPGLQYLALYVNVSKPPLDDKTVRQALAWAIDRQSIIDVAYLGNARPAQGPFPPAFGPVFQENPPLAYSLDQEKAKDLLAKAGKSDLTMTLNIRNASVDTQVAEMLREQFAAVGIQMAIRPLDVTEQVSEAIGRKDDATLFTMSGRIDPDFQSYDHFTSTGPNNYPGYSNPEVDRLLDQARAEYDVEMRAALYRQVNDILLEELPRIYILFPQLATVTRDAVEGFVPYQDYVIRLWTVGVRR